MKNYQKPEVEIVKFESLEYIMDEPPGMGGGSITGSVTDE